MTAGHELVFRIYCTYHAITCCVSINILTDTKHQEQPHQVIHGYIHTVYEKETLEGFAVQDMHNHSFG